jgi:hypothetical protein
MSLIEEALSQTPEQRLEAHQRALDMILELQERGEPLDALITAKEAAGREKDLYAARLLRAIKPKN